MDYVRLVLMEQAFHGAYTRNTIYSAEETVDFTFQRVTAGGRASAEYLYRISVLAIVGNELVHYGFFATVLAVVVMDNKYLHLNLREGVTMGVGGGYELLFAVGVA